MNILVTGAKGMVGTALCNNLKNIRDGKNKTRPALNIEEIFEYDLNSTPEELDEYCQKADFVFNLAGVNRPENPEDFMKGNFGFASDLLNCLKNHNNKATIMLSSSIQATLAGRFGNSEYGRSKKAGEELFFQYAQETGAKVAVYRFVNLMGHSRPKYNSAVSTFCWAVANDEPFTVNDRSTELELLYIDDLVEGMFDLLEGKEQHCEFDGVETVLKADGRYCCVPVTHKVTLGEVVDLLQEFKAQPTTLMMPKMPDGSFAKKLYSLYLTYLPTDKFKYDGDADRCLCVDEKGNVITGDHILYIYGCYMKERGKLLTNTVVTTVMSNFGLYKAFDEQGIGYAKTAVGDKYVYEYMAKNGCRIGGEQSGHIIFSKYASTGDGILTSLKMMEVMLAKKQPMSKLAEPLKIYPQVLENVRVTDKKAAQDDAAVQAAVKAVAEALGDTGRILVRESGTEPVVRVMVEAPDHDTCQKYVSQVVETIKSRGYGV